MRANRIAKRLRLKDKVKDAAQAYKQGMTMGVIAATLRITEAAHGLSYGEGYKVDIN
jgi:hypothetical protein